MEKLVSVIVPLYNAEIFLDRCIQSVINQTYKNFELILIDDGSTDRSKYICKKYSSFDKRIKIIINRKNSGPSSARNIGIKSANGDFVFFLDTDDFIEPKTLEILISNQEKYSSDLVMSNFNKVESDGKVIPKSVSFKIGSGLFNGDVKELSKEEIKDYIKHFFKHPSNHLVSYCWARLYKLSIIKENNIKANEGMYLFEDFIFNLEYLRYANKLTFVNKHLYNYTMNSQSLSMRVINSKTLLRDIKIFSKNAQSFFTNDKSNLDIKERICHTIIHYVIIFLVRSCWRISDYNKKYISNEINNIINDLFIQESLQFYKPSKGDSKILPFLMKQKLIDFLMFISQYKSFNRYGFKENIPPVIIYGAGIVGEILLKRCKEEGIKIECFCDSSKKVAKSKFCGLDVIHISQLDKKYKNAIFLISAASIKDVVQSLNERGFSKWYAGGLILKDIDISQSKPELDYAKFAIENCILCHEGYLHPDKIFLRSIDFIITERCSLRCKDCSNLMQYYESPKNCDKDMLFKSIDILCNVVDEIMDFRIIGGDVFMNIEWPMIVKKAIKEPKIKRVILYTNGTLVPRKEDVSCLKDKKVLVIISDYGKISRRLNDLKQIFKKEKINYHILEVNEWLDCSQIKKHNRSIEQNKEIYKVCCAKNMLTLSDGKLFRCPYAANALRLHAVPDYNGDYINLFKEGIDNAKNKVKDYLFNTSYLRTCDYCSGRPLSGVEVKPAVQISKPLKYKRYK